MLISHEAANNPSLLNTKLKPTKQTQLLAEVTEVLQFLGPTQRVQSEATTIHDRLRQAAAAEHPAELEVLAFPLHRSLDALNRHAGALTPSLHKMLRRHIEAFDGFVSGANSILEARQHELGITAEGKRLLKENTEVTRALTTAVNQLVSEAKLDIQTGNAEVTKAQRFGIGVLMAAVTLSLISSTLIVWLYVDRNLIARLTALSDSMLAIAGGNLQARLPEDAVMK